MGIETLRKVGITPLRVFSGRGVKPHLSLSFYDVEGIERIFGIDTTPFSKKMVEPDSYLITHAHSDHYGKSAMSSKLSVASKETATALELLHGREFNGSTFEMEGSFLIGETEVSTFRTNHTIGSSAYLWENECGVRILVTGDVKDYREPACSYHASKLGLRGSNRYVTEKPQSHKITVRRRRRARRTEQRCKRLDRSTPRIIRH